MREIMNATSTDWLEKRLGMIPSLSDCHRVPVGATLPKGTPFWIVYKVGLAQWHPYGYNSDYTVHATTGSVYLTAEEITVKSDHDVWDETDKRDRVDVNDNVWRWVDTRDVWERAFFGSPGAVAFGSLASIQKRCGDRFLTGFAEERVEERREDDCDQD